MTTATALADLKRLFGSAWNVNSDAILTYLANSMVDSAGDLEVDGVLQLGPTATAALHLGGGIAGTPMTWSAADKNSVELWSESTATSGDSRGIYVRHYFSGGGGSGEALRAYGTVNNISAGGTVNGGHISLLLTGASAAIAGAAHALRLDFEADASVNIGGTCDILMLESNLGLGATPSSKMPFLRLNNIGAVKLDYAFAFTAPSTTMFAAAGTGANSAAVSTGGVASKVIKVQVDGTDYWMPLFSSNS